MIVTKIGGSIAARADPVLDELATVSETVLVHGFGPQTTRLADERDIETRWITSPGGVRSRFTDQATLDVMADAAGRVAARLADRLADREVPARRVPAHDGVLRAEAKPALRHERDDGRVVLVRGNRSGRVTDVRPEPIEQALAAGELPLVTPLARDDEGLVSVDADRAAAAIAAELDAAELVLLTDVPRVRDAEGDPIEQLPAERIADLREAGGLEGGMLRKALAAREAVEAGVERVWIADGRRENPISRVREGDATEVSR